MIQIEFNQEKIELPQECSVADFIKDNPNKQNDFINGELIYLHSKQRQNHF